MNQVGVVAELLLRRIRRNSRVQSLQVMWIISASVDRVKQWIEAWLGMY